MASKALAKPEKQVTCPICLEQLTEPLSLGCGHSLCQACVTVDSEEAETGSGKERGCPLCGCRDVRRDLEADRPQADEVEKLREVQLSTGTGKKADFCALHGEKLQLFCQEDQKFLCWLCERSREHRGHHTFLREEVARECQDMSGIMKWSEIWTLRKPKSPSTKLKRVFQAPRLSTVLRMFRELKDIQDYWVDVTLNPVNLNLNLVLSEDHRQVRAVPIWPFKCDNYGILGSQYFSSGKHYWEIDVSNKTAWLLGVYCRKPSRKFDSSCSTTRTNTCSRYRPQHGYWVIGLREKFEYYAFDESSSSGPKVVALSVDIPLCRIGVFLNFEAGTVSFYNITNHGSLIYTFRNCFYPRPVYPYFNPWNCPVPLTLCPPSS
uniref:Tripartite motif containing 34 n=1 Tax=Chinchilla lanigera TaxID=34839 RepID=A0A8C2VX65_CHILA